MTDSTNVQLAEIKKDTEHLRDSVDKLTENIQKNYITKNSHKLQVTEALDARCAVNHKSLITNNKLILAAAILLGGSTAGAGGNFVREMLIKLFGG